MIANRLSPSPPGLSDDVAVLAHSLPISYVLSAVEGNGLASRVPLVPNAAAYPLGADELDAAVQALDQWLAAPTF